MITQIYLEGEAVEPDNTGLNGWWVDGNIVTIRNASGLSTYRLPKMQVVTVLRLGDGRARLGIGGFTRQVVFVTGPTATIMQLREAVL